MEDFRIGIVQVIYSGMRPTHFLELTALMLINTVCIVVGFPCGPYVTMYCDNRLYCGFRVIVESSGTIA